MRPVGLLVLAQLKRQASGQELIKHNAQAVEIAAAIDGPLCAGGVLRGHIGGRTARDGQPGLGKGPGDAT